MESPFTIQGYLNNEFRAFRMRFTKTEFIFAEQLVASAAYDWVDQRTTEQGKKANRRTVECPTAEFRRVVSLCSIFFIK